MLRAAIASLALASLFLGCASSNSKEPTTEELENADYGPPPQDPEGLVQAEALLRYRDRAVAHVNVGTPRRAWWGELGRLTKKRDIRYGWAVPFRGMKLGFNSLGALAVEGRYFFYDGEIRAVEDDKGLHMLSE